MSIDDIWGAIKVGNINDFDRRKLQPWFEAWVARIRDEQPVKWNDMLFNRQLLFPCHFFDDAEGFKHLTRCLVYTTHTAPLQSKSRSRSNLTDGVLAPNLSHVSLATYNISIAKSLKPNQSGIHVDQLNAVRDRLRTTLQGQISAEVDRCLKQSPCDCNETAICAYLKEVGRIGIAPWGDTFSKSSIKEITDKLELFDQAHIRKPNVKPCDCECSPRCGCSIAWDEAVKKFRKDTLEYFDGLCLDCMKHSPRNDSKYWNRPSHQDGYDKDCGIEHGEASWYFSFMGYH